MDISIISTNKQPELHRSAYEISVSYGEKVTPSRAELITKIAEKAKVDPALVVVRSIEPRFGETTSPVKAYVYADVDNLKRIETSYQRKRNTLPEKKPAEEQAA